MDSVQRIGGANGLLRHILNSETNSLANESLPKLKTTDISAVIPNATILNLISLGKPVEALSISLANCEAMRNTYGDQHQFSLNSLANLLEHSVFANDAQHVSQDHIELLHSCALDTNIALSHFRMRVSSRLCEFSAHFGGGKTALREIASEMLESLHLRYPLADINEDSKAYCARASLVSAAHIARWTMKEERPDFRGLDYMALCAHERLAVFGQERGDFYMGLYELRRGKVEQALERLDQVATSSLKTNFELAIAALEAPIPQLIETLRFEEARVRTAKLAAQLSLQDGNTDFAKARARIANYQTKLSIQ